MKSALCRDYFRQICKTPRRFFAILLIVALGVAFFSGVRAASPDMRLTVDTYFDQYAAPDVQLLSTAGFDEADVEALRQGLGGEAVIQPGYTADGFVQRGDNRLLLHFRSLDIQEAAAGQGLEQPVLMEGQLPTAADECLVDEELLENGTFQIGDRLVIDTEDDPDMADTLSRMEYTIVGGARSTAYISLQRGTSSKGDGSLDGFAFLPEENFSLPVYTQVLLQDTGASGLSRFTDEYDTRIDAFCDTIEDIAAEQGPVRLQSMREEAQAELDDARQQLEEGQTELDDGARQLEDGWAEWEDGRQQLEEQQAAYEREIAAAEEQLEESAQLLDDSQREIEERTAQLEEGRRQLEAGEAELNASAEELEAGRAALDTLSGQIEALQAALAQLPGDSQQAAELRAQLAALEAAYTQASTQLEEGEAAYQQGRQTLEQTRRQLEEGEAALEEGRQQLEAGRAEYEAGLRELESAKADGQAQLDDARRTLEDSRAELEEAQAAYDEEAPGARQDLEEARQEIADGQAQLDDLEEPQWISLDLDMNEGFAGYAQDADRIAAIGLVFPLIFFLVAALVSLTNMTRMVEDDRNLIGLYKALGYGRFTIAAKYLLYAGLSTVIGIVVGIVVGQKLFPWIIFDAYGILYRLPDLVMPYNAAYSFWAAAGALICAVLPAFLVCQTELFSTPASLMRPRAPKEGKRILLERIPFIWKHINFSKKVTCRNIFRYKKRLLMTVVGIAGCTALIFTGFGLRDSIQSIISLQYDEIQKYDMQVSLNDDADEAGRAAVDEILAAQGAGHIPFLQESVDVTNGQALKSATLLVPGDMERFGDFIDLRTRKGHTPLTLDDTGVVITEKLSMLLDVQAGDTVDLRDADNQVYTCRIAGITENYAMHYVYMSDALYTQLTGRQPVNNAILCQLSDTSEAAENALSTRLLEQECVTSTSFNTGLRQNFSDMISSMDVVIVVLILSAAALAFIVLFSLITINIDERRRELATLKVLGFYDGETAMYIYRENIILTLLGILAGLVAGRLLEAFVVTTVEVDMVMFSRTVNWFNYLIAAAMTAVFALLVNLLMTRVIKKIDMVESMKSVE